MDLDKKNKVLHYMSLRVQLEENPNDTFVFDELKRLYEIERCTNIAFKPYPIKGEYNNFVRTDRKLEDLIADKTANLKKLLSLLEKVNK